MELGRWIKMSGQQLNIIGTAQSANDHALRNSKSDIPLGIL